MSLTSDQAAKIKAAVKVKLVEIGAYVDDQLSDYVMIMITNKKNEKQMTEDLELFLGGIEQAETFSSWLHTLIKKTLDLPAETTSKSSSSSNHSTSSSHKKSSSSSKLNKSKNGISTNGLNQSMNASHNDTDELAIGIDTNEFNDDLNEESDKKSKEKSRRSSGTKERKSSVSTPKEVEKNLPEEKLSKPGPEVVNPFTKIVKQESKVRESRSTQQQSSSLSSKVTVISSQFHPNKDEPNDEEEFDKNRLSSIVKVSDRKYNVPRSMQPSKNILLRAVDAANTSVSSSSSRAKSIADKKLEEIRSKRFTETTEIETTTKRDRSNEQLTKRLRKFETDPNEQNQMSVFTKDIRKFITGDTRNVEIQEESVMKSSEEKKITIDTNETNNQANDVQEPKFIVTLTGLESNPFAKNLKKTPQKRTLSDMESVENPNDQLDYDEEIEDEYMDDGNEYVEMETESEEIIQKKKLTRCTFWPMCDKGDQCQYLHPNKPCTTFPNCPYGSQCHYIHPSCRFDGFCTRIDCPFTHVIKKPTLPDPNKTDTILDGKTEVTTGSNAPAGTAPTITINKIQSTYTYNKNNVEAQPSDVKSSNGTAEPAVNKFTLNNTSSQIRMPRAAAPSTYFKPTASPYSFAASNQYSFVNRAKNPNTTIKINCKYAQMCQNPNCIYLHPNIPQKSQMKWTPALANATNKPRVETNADDQSIEAPKHQEVVANNSMITQSS